MPGACLAVGEKKQNLPAPSLMSVMVVYQRKALGLGTARSRAVNCGRRASRPFKRRELRGMHNHGFQLGKRPAPRVRRGHRCPWSRARGLASSRECGCREPVPRNLTSDPFTPFLPARSECPLAPKTPPLGCVCRAQTGVDGGCITNLIRCDRFEDESDPPSLPRCVDFFRFAPQEKDEAGDGSELVCAALELGKRGVDSRKGCRYA